MSIEFWWNDTDMVKPKQRKENLSQSNFAHHKSHTDPDAIKPSLHGEMACLKIHTMTSYHYLSNNLTYSLLYWYSNNRTQNNHCKLLHLQNDKHEYKENYKLQIKQYSTQIIVECN